MVVLGLEEREEDGGASHVTSAWESTEVSCVALRFELNRGSTRTKPCGARRCLCLTATGYRRG
jgi:hypothetical protein